MQERLQRGEITLIELAERLQACVYQVLYRSQALFPFSDADLQALLDQSRAFNAAHGITGLLLYSTGQFVQVLEGDHATVRALYARIQQAPRHARVETVREELAPRAFTAWSMAFGHVAPFGLDVSVAALQGKAPAPPLVVEPLMHALLQAFA